MEDILHQLIWRIQHYLEVLKHVRWCRISSISSTCILDNIHGFLLTYCLPVSRRPDAVCNVYRVGKVGQQNQKKHTGFKGVDLLHFDKLGPPNPFSDQAKIQLKPYIIYFKKRLGVESFQRFLFMFFYLVFVSGCFTPRLKKAYLQMYLCTSPVFAR